MNNNTKDKSESFIWAIINELKPELNIGINEIKNTSKKKTIEYINNIQSTIMALEYYKDKTLYNSYMIT